jgi:hypothetical protein
MIDNIYYILLIFCLGIFLGVGLASVFVESKTLQEGVNNDHAKALTVFFFLIINRGYIVYCTEIRNFTWIDACQN